MREDDDARTPANLQLWLRMAKDFPSEALITIVAMIAAWISVELVVYLPRFLQQAIDDHLVPHRLEGLEAIAFAYLGVTLAGFVFEFAYTYAIGFAATRAITKLRRKVYSHTLSMAQAFFDQRPTGRLLTRATSDVEALGETLTAGAFTIVLDAILVFRTIFAMFLLHHRMTVVVLLVAPPIAIFVNVIRKKLRDLFGEVRDAISVLNAYTAERLGGMDVVQLYSEETRTLAEHNRMLARYRIGNVRSNIWDALLYAGIDGIATITVALLLWYGSGGWNDDIVTAGLLAMFIQYTGQLFRPIQEFSQKIAVLQRAAASLEKIYGLLDYQQAITPGSQRLPQAKGQIHLSNLKFAYQNGVPILNGVEFHVQPGEVVALVGRTGSGKSSIARLLTRTYDGYEGSITLDGLELREVHPDDVRNAIGMVRQDVQLFPGDVRFNLTLGKKISDERLREVIHLAQADEAVEKLGGLDGKIQHQGANLSVGEAQLLSFARVMAHDPPVVLLDEATASVDTLTETRIQAATKVLFERKTVLVIAHRLSTVVDADRIVVLDQGKVLETGSHHELMARDGAWAALFRQQFTEAHEAGSPNS